VRYDDRGHGATGGSVATVTFHQRTLDAIAVAQEVATRADLAPGELFLLGHSEGVAHVSEAASAVPEVSGLLLVAGVGTNGETAWQEQFDVVTHRYGMPQAWISSVEASRASIASQIVAGTYPDPTFGGLTTTFWKEFFLFDGAALAADAARPTAIFHGAADWQVDPRDADLLAEAITGAGQSDVTVHLYAGDGHFVSAAPPGYPSSGDEYWVPKGWDPAMVSDLVAWVNAH
jgi:alpha-beta hydrolase superfamily lysophospholipase